MPRGWEPGAPHRPSTRGSPSGRAVAPLSERDATRRRPALAVASHACASSHDSSRHKPDNRGNAVTTASANPTPASSRPPARARRPPRADAGARNSTSSWVTFMQYSPHITHEAAAEPVSTAPTTNNNAAVAPKSGSSQNSSGVETAVASGDPEQRRMLGGRAQPLLQHHDEHEHDHRHGHYSPVKNRSQPAPPASVEASAPV